MCLKKLLCKHEYRSLTTYSKDSDASVGYREEQIHVIYCPKCKHKKEVNEYEYKSIMAIKEIDEVYLSEKRKQKRIK